MNFKKNTAILSLVFSFVHFFGLCSEMPAVKAGREKYIRKIFFNGLALRGKFTEKAEGIFSPAGDFNVGWNFDIVVGSHKEMVIDIKNKPATIEGADYLELPFYGRIINLKNLYISEERIEFDGIIGDGLVTLTDVGVDVKFGKNALNFLITGDTFRVRVDDPMRFNLSKIPKIKDINITIASAGSGYTMNTSSNSMTLQGEGFVQIIEPSLKFYFDKELKISVASIEGKGKAEIFGLAIEEADFVIEKTGAVSIKIRKGVLPGGSINIQF